MWSVVLPLMMKASCLFLFILFFIGMERVIFFCVIGVFDWWNLIDQRGAKNYFKHFTCDVSAEFSRSIFSG